jgi:hypothetical protein
MSERPAMNKVRNEQITIKQRQITTTGLTAPASPTVWLKVWLKMRVIDTKKTGYIYQRCNPLISLGINGRRGGIRTRDPLHPMQVRYQAALHADKL